MMSRQFRKLTNNEWAEIERDGPGSRLYRGKQTFFYNGEILYENDDNEYGDLEDFLRVYDEDVRDSWEVLIVMRGVREIPWKTFYYCTNLKVVIMADTVRRIGEKAFKGCKRLLYVKLSSNLEYIGICAFYGCESLISIFLPPSCTEVDDEVFYGCEDLIIFCVHLNTQLGENVIAGTSLIYRSPFETDYLGQYEDNNEEVNEWIKNLNGDEEYALHRACSSFNPIEDILYTIIERQGLRSLHVRNEFGITALDYLVENPFSNVDQYELINRYVMDMAGELDR